MELHSDKQLKGTDIGLRTVDKIVMDANKHASSIVVLIGGGIVEKLQSSGKKSEATEVSKAVEAIKKAILEASDL